MNWTNIFKEEKPINIYESSYVDEWLDTITENEHSKRVYKTYFDRISEWIRNNNLTTLNTESAENFLVWQVNKSGAKQGNARWSIFKRYNDYLVKKGKLTVNPWDACDLVKCGCDKETVSIEIAEQKKKRKEKEDRLKAMESGEEVKEETPKFTLSDIALLLIAIEERDEETIKEVLGK